MKKIALSLTAAGILFAGVAGCGDVNDAGMDDTQRGYGTNQTRGWDRTTGFGADQGRVNEHTDRGFIQEGRGQTGFGGGTGYGTGYNTQVRVPGQQNGALTRERGFGSVYDYQTGNRNPGTGIHGQNRANRGRTTAYAARENAELRGFSRGITGNDRPGMIDENGVLNDQYNARDIRSMYRRQNRNVQHRSQFGNDGARLNEGTRGTQGMNRRNQGTQGLNRKNQGTQGMNRRNQGKQGLNRQNEGTRGLNRGASEELRKNGAKHLDHGKYDAKAIQDGQGDWFYNGDEDENNDGRLSRRISQRLTGMNDLRDPRVIVRGNNVVIGTETDGDANRLQNNLRNDLSGLAGNRDIHVVTDRDRVRNIRDMDDRIRAGEPFEEFADTFNDMLQDIGRAARRPFEQSR